MSIPKTQKPPWDILVFIGVPLLLAGLYLSITDLYLIGFELDDGYYYLGAKALAMGLGYHMPFFPGQPALVKYPPGLSCLLAPFIYLLPSFKAHAPVLKVLNLSTAALSIGMCSLWANQQLAERWPYKKYLILPVSVLGMGFLGLNPAWMNVAIELLSEPLFCLISAIILWLSVLPPDTLSSPERYGPKRYGIMLFFTLVLSYIRSFGLVLGLALCIWHWKEGRPKWSIGSLLGIGLGVLPWIIWGTVHPPVDILDGSVLYRSFNESYTHSFVLDLTNEFSLIGLFTSGLCALIQYIAVSFFPFLSALPEKILLLLGFPLGLFFFYQLGKASLQKNAPLYQLYLLIYFLILPGWSFHQQYERFLLPLLPLLWVFLFSYVAQSTQTFWKKAGLTLLCLLLVVNACFYGQHFLEKYSHKEKGGDPLTQSLANGSDPQYPRIWDEFQSSVAVVKKHTNPNDWIWTTELPLPTAIYAERPVWDYFSLILHPPLKSIGELSTLNQMLDTLADSQWKQIQHRQFRYVMLVPEIKGGQITAPTDPITQHLLQRHGQYFQRLECSKPAGSFCLLRVNQATK